MAGIRIRITPIQAPGARVDVGAFQQDVVKMMRSATAEGQRHIAVYPPQRLRKSNYRRTGTLKRSWSKKVSAAGNKVVGIVGSSSAIAPYNRFVQGPRKAKGGGKSQLPLFRRAGWKGVDELQDFLQDEVQRGLQRIVDRVAR